MTLPNQHLGAGPFLGTLIAVVFYKFIKILEYETANPGQDGDEDHDPTKNEQKGKEVTNRRMTMTESGGARAARS